MLNQLSDLTACIYDGMTKPTKFIEFFKLTSIINAWNEAAQLVNIKAFVKDKAEAAIASITPTTIEECYAFLRTKCCETSERMMVKFRERRPLLNESFTKYAVELKKLLKGASPDLNDAQILINIRTQLRLYMPKESLILLHVYKDKNLADLIQSLDEAMPGGANEASTQAHASWNPFPTPKVEIKAEPLDINFMQAQNRSFNNSSSNRFNGNCHFCGLYGHRFADCKKRMSQSNNSAVSLPNVRALRPNNQYMPPNNNGNLSTNYMNQHRFPFNNNNSSHQRPPYNSNMNNSFDGNYNSFRPNQHQTTNGQQSRRNNSSSSASFRPQANSTFMSSVSNRPEEQNQSYQSNPAYGSNLDSGESMNISHELENESLVVSSSSNSIDAETEFPYFSYHSTGYCNSIVVNEDSDLIDFPFGSDDKVRVNVMSSETNMLESRSACVPRKYATLHQSPYATFSDGSSNIDCELNGGNDFVVLEPIIKAIIDIHSPISLIKDSVFKDFSVLAQPPAACEIKFRNNILVGRWITLGVSAQRFHGRIRFFATKDISKMVILGQNFVELTDILIIDSHMIKLDSTCSNPVQEGFIQINATDFNRLSSLNTALLKIPGSIAMFGEFPIQVNMLVDGGSTHSFISPFVLNESYKTHLVTPDSPIKQKRSFVITSATHDVTSDCTVAIATMSMQGWSGKFQFTISDKITKNDVVIGRDFLSFYNVKISHGSNIMTIGDTIIDFNSQVGSTCRAVHFDPVVTECGDHQQPTASSPLCYTISESTLAPLSQSLLKLSHAFQTTDKVLIFEPVDHLEAAGCLVARSIHDDLNNCFCNIINTLQVPITIGKNVLMGSFVNGSLLEQNETVPINKVGKCTNNIGNQSHDAPSIFSTNVDKDAPPPNAIPSEWHDICQIPIGDRLSDTQKFQLRVMLLKNHKAFQWDPNAISRTNLVEHEINTGNALPIRTKQYPLPTVALDQIRQQTVKMLKDGTIRHSNSSWQSPILLIKQQTDDGSVKYRFCIDLRKVNAVTAKDSYSLPRIKETCDKLNSMLYFSTCDIDRAFWQVGVKESDKCKHAFAVDGRLYESNVMVFGSQNAPATFQRLINTVLSGLTWRQCLAYIDDILVFSKEFLLHLTHIDEVLSRIINASLKLKPSK